MPDITIPKLIYLFEPFRNRLSARCHETLMHTNTQTMYNIHIHIMYTRIHINKTSRYALRQNRLSSSARKRKFKNSCKTQLKPCSEKLMPLHSTELSFFFHSKAGECTRIPFLNNGRVRPQKMSLLSQGVCSEKKTETTLTQGIRCFWSREKREGETSFLGG